MKNEQIDGEALLEKMTPETKIELLREQMARLGDIIRELQQQVSCQHRLNERILKAFEAVNNELKFYVKASYTVKGQQF